MSAPPTTAPPLILPRTIAKGVAEELLVVVTAMTQRTRAASRVRARVDWIDNAKHLSPQQREGLTERIQALAEYIYGLKV